MSSGKIVIAPGIFLEEDELHENFIRASGPGGQNVNKVATSVQLRFDVLHAEGLTDDVRHRALRLAGQRATKDGFIVIEAGRYRTQERNREDARQRLVSLLGKAAEPPPPPRKKTRPSRGSVERRLKAKANRAGIKKMRGKIGND